MCTRNRANPFTLSHYVILDKLKDGGSIFQSYIEYISLKLFEVDYNNIIAEELYNHEYNEFKKNENQGQEAEVRASIAISLKESKTIMVIQ